MSATASAELTAARALLTRHMGRGLDRNALFGHEGLQDAYEAGDAVLRDLGGAPGAFARLAASYDLGRVRFAGNVHGERVVQRGRDDVDVIVLAGASYRTLDVEQIGHVYEGLLERTRASLPAAEVNTNRLVDWFCDQVVR